MNKTDNQTGSAFLVSRAVIINKLKLLLVRRTPSDRFNPNLWEIPGGKLAKGEDLHKSLEREVLEETGLIIEPISRLAYYTSEIAGPNGPDKYTGETFVKIVALAKTTTSRVKLSDSHTEFEWVTFSEALDRELTGFTKKALLVLEKRIKDYFWRN